MQKPFVTHTRHTNWIHYTFISFAIQQPVLYSCYNESQWIQCAICSFSLGLTYNRLIYKKNRAGATNYTKPKQENNKNKKN